MSVVLASFIVFALAMAGMAVGVLFGRAPISGSCGGLGGKCASCTRTCRRKADPDQS